MIRRSRPLKLKPGSRRIRHFVHRGDTKYPLIADSRLRISDLQLMNNFSNRTIRNPQFNGISVPSCVSVVKQDVLLLQRHCLNCRAERFELNTPVFLQKLGSS